MMLAIFLIPEIASIRQAMKKIGENRHGFILTTSDAGVVKGLATDGDIREMLIKGVTVDDQIGKCANPNFLWADENTPREVILKQLDNSIKFIPLLDSNRKLIDLISKDRIPRREEGKVYSRARSPVRISFGGGGSDLTNFFSIENTGAVINSTITLYSHATLRVRDDKKILIISRDLQDSIFADDLKSFLGIESRFKLVQAVINAVHPDFGFDLYLHSDFPIQSGLGGSSVISAAILGCFNEFRSDRWDNHEMAEIAFQAERLGLGIAGGWQDQYATVFGGFNFIEFSMKQNVVHPLRIAPETLFELEESLVLCDTGIPHESGEIHQSQRVEMENASVLNMVEQSVGLTYQMRNYLLRGSLLDFGKSMHDIWMYKKRFSKKISTLYLDEIYEGAQDNGALGGKLLGAGGGGFFLFYAPPFQKNGLIDYLASKGLKIIPFRFELEGLKSWTVREARNSV